MRKHDAVRAMEIHQKTENALVSESEKLGIAILGRHFSDKAEHVPIKKRRSIFQSSLAPPHAISGDVKIIVFLA